MPLEPGTSWLYQVWVFRAPDTAKAEITRTVSVNVDGTIHEASAFLPPYPRSGPKPQIELLYWNGPGGLYWLGGISPNDTLFYKSLMFKYPANVGESWSTIRINNDFYGRFYFFDTLKIDLVSKDETIDTPAGKFKCHVYHYRKKPVDDVNVEWDYYHYYLPGIGRVAYITKSTSDGATHDRMYYIGK